MPSAQTGGNSQRTIAASSAWPIISKVAAAVLGGFILTYWAGAAFAKLAVLTGMLGRTDAGLASGLVQLVVYTTVVIWAGVSTSMRTTWLALLSLTAACVVFVMTT